MLHQLNHNRLELWLQGKGWNSSEGNCVAKAAQRLFEACYKMYFKPWHPELLLLLAQSCSYATSAWCLGSLALLAFLGFPGYCFGRQSFKRILFGKGDSCLLSFINVSCVIAFRTWKTIRDLKLSFTSHSLVLLFASISAYFEPFSFSLQAKHWSSSQAILQSMVIHACLANNCNITGQNMLYSPGSKAKSLLGSTFVVSWWFSMQNVYQTQWCLALSFSGCLTDSI